MMTNVNNSRWPDLIWRWCLTCSRPPGISAARRWSWSSSVPWWRWRGEGDVVRAGEWSIAWSCQSSLRRPTDHGVVRLLWALPWSVLSSATTRQPPSLPPIKYCYQEEDTVTTRSPWENWKTFTLCSYLVVNINTYYIHVICDGF